jgi:glycosyltransferase involved in cell wall biosynthesis
MLQRPSNVPAPLKVLHLWYADYPWDVRIEKVNLALKQAGMSVELLARNIRNSASRENIDGVEVHRLRWFRAWPSIARRVNVIASLPAFINPIWVLHVYRVSRMTQPDVIIVRDLPLAPTAIWVGRLLKIPVVLDMAENYPSFLRSLQSTGAFSFADMLVRNPRLATIVERYVVRNAQAIVCVIEESAQRLMRLGVPESKLTIVRNTPQTDNELLQRARRSENQVLTIAYLGVIERHRGVQDLVRAVAESHKRGLQLRLIVIGDGQGFKELKELAANLGVLENGVELLGRIENRQALDIVAGADIGAIPHMPCEAWDTTIPNKLFDYMSLGLPVVTSNVGPVQRIVSEEGCGLAYEWGNIPELCSRIDALRSPSQRKIMGEAGRRAVHSKYNWSNDGRTLASTLRVVHDAYQSERIAK